MKTPCNSCGIHFDDEFEVTLRSECSYWLDHNALTLSKKDKRKIWRWIFKCPTDSIAASAYKIMMFDWKLANSTYQGNWFEQNVQGYKRWPDQKRRDFQREYSKFMQTFDDDKRSQLFVRIFINNNKKWQIKSK